LEIWREAPAEAWPRLGINTQQSGVRIPKSFITLTAILSRTRGEVERCRRCGREKRVIVIRDWLGARNLAYHLSFC
jgi:hypothetical protein